MVFNDCDVFLDIYILVVRVGRIVNRDLGQDLELVVVLIVDHDLVKNDLVQEVVLLEALLQIEAVKVVLEDTKENFLCFKLCTCHYDFVYNFSRFLCLMISVVISFDE